MALQGIKNNMENDEFQSCKQARQYQNKLYLQSTQYQRNTLLLLF